MNPSHLEAFAQIPQPFSGVPDFIDDIRKPLEYHFRKGRGCDPGKTADCMADGAEIIIDFPRKADFPETAFTSLRRVLKAKEITEKKGGYPLRFLSDPRLEKEEYSLSVSTAGTELKAADADGLRRGIYFLEDRICEAEGAAVTEGAWRRKPFVKHRISRCFFGPTNRPPFYIDELMNEIDYYPEEYLNKLAHEGVNGLWLTMYFRDLPSTLFPGRGKDAPKRLEKLRKTVEKCGRYGIRIYVFLSEPKRFGHTHFSQPMEDGELHPEMIGTRANGFGFFCTSTENGMKYLRESTERIFSAVPKLGGIINIMSGEDNGSCAGFTTIVAEELLPEELCPRCSKRDHAEIFRELAVMFTETIRKYNPDAEYIGWFYAPRVRMDSPYAKRLLHVAEKWPDGASLMFNFESGGKAEQLGKERIVFDYSLAYVGPSALFAEAAETAPRTGAKLQVGCSHENASVPFIPVPDNLYRKYQFLYEHHVPSIMQCWYFGNYPGLMNRAAGMLSFEPFPKSGKEFLTGLARPEWGADAPQVAEAWDLFSQAYRKFPANLMFEWYGPLHHCIAWPLYLFPEDRPVSPSWILKNFPEVSGDRIGECLGYFHTLSEALELCCEMRDVWQKGMDLLEPLRSVYREDPARIADIDLSAAILLQIRSACNLLSFYSLREDMLFRHQDHLAEMKKIVTDEISNTEKMLSLCENDTRLGYHSEAEGYLFFPAKLKVRKDLLLELLNDDFPKFDLNAAWIREYTGEIPKGRKACLHPCGSEEEKFGMGNGAFWHGSYDEKNLYITIGGTGKNHFFLVLEPCRMWPPLSITFRGENLAYADNGIFVSDPGIRFSFGEDEIRVEIPLNLFNGFRHEGFPMRMNIWSREPGLFQWNDPQFWPARLQYGQYNPAGASWLCLV